MTSTRFTLPLLLAFFVLPSAVEATFFHNTTGLGSYESSVTFSEVAVSHGAFVTNEFSAYGVEFPSYPVYDSNVTGSGNNVSGAGLRRYGYGDGSTPTVIVIKFTETLTEAAFALVSDDGNGAQNKFEALLGNAVQETDYVDAVANRTDNFYGFTGINFDAIRVTVAGATGGNTVLDNIQLGAAFDGGTGSVPEPATAVIWTALGGLGLIAYRRRRVA